MDNQYDVFISYSRKDYVDENQNVIPNNIVSQIKELLSNEGISYWFDEDGVGYGQDFIERIVSNIEASKIFLFISTKNSNQSPWTCKEIASADMYNKYILPLRIDASPYNKKVMFRISDLNYIDYYANPEKGLSDLMTTIKTYLNQFKQAKLIEEIRIECDIFTQEMQKFGAKREILIQKIKTIESSKHREELLALINSSLLHSNSSTTELLKENKSLKERIKNLESVHSTLVVNKENPFIQAIKTCLRKYAVFSGRASRSEFWWWYLFYFAIRLVSVVLFVEYADTAHTLRTDISLIMYFIVSIGGLLPTIAVAIRRCHDTNHNGWWILCPIYNIIILCMPTKEEV